MSILANTSIRLNVHLPKKDAVVDAPGTPATANELRLWAAASIPPNKTQSIVGAYWKLFRWAKSNMPAIEASIADPVVIHMSMLRDSDAGIEIDGTPTADDVRLEIGTAIAATSKSHFLDRTFKRIVERWLEESK